MNIAVLSGKGGTGKTTLSTNLAVLMGANYIDCDVEEPNGFLFLNPSSIKKEEVGIEYPCIDSDKCSLCGKCVKVCQFNALAKVRDGIVHFEKICHGCGACQIICESNAITYEKRAIGVIEEGILKDIACKRGVLNIGEPMAVPVIRQLLKNLGRGVNLIDCAPGTSCNVVNTLRYADGAILVTEPSEFGLHDLIMAVELVRKFNIPFGVVINKSIPQRSRVQLYCEKEAIHILGLIPNDITIAKSYSKGELLIENEEYKGMFYMIANQIKEAVTWSL